MDHRYHRVSWGAGEDRKRTSAANWHEPLKWDRAAKAAGRYDTVFCLSLGDIWDNEIDPIWRRDAFAVMEQTPNLIYLLLSKRIGNAVKMCSALHGNPRLPPNAAIGATMVNQQEWNRDAERLKFAGIDLGAKFTFVSIEPMLGPIDMMEDARWPHRLVPDWVIVGGESGRDARPMHPDWVRSIRDQCAAASVPFFFKQYGEWAPCDRSRVPDAPAHIWGDDGTAMFRVGKRAAGHLLDGTEWRQFPRAAEGGA